MLQVQAVSIPSATNIIPRQKIDQHKISGNILLQMVTEPDAARIMGLRWVLNHFVGHPVDEGNKVFFMQDLRHVTKTAGPQAGEVTYTHQESGHSLTLNSLGDIVAFLGGEAK